MTAILTIIGHTLPPVLRLMVLPTREIEKLADRQALTLPEVRHLARVQREVGG